MRLFLLAVGTRMPAWVTEGFAEYPRGTSSGYVAATHDDYLDVIAITEFNAAQRRKNGN